MGRVAKFSEGGLIVFLNESIDVGTKMNVFVPLILD